MNKVKMPNIHVFIPLTVQSFGVWGTAKFSRDQPAHCLSVLLPLQKNNACAMIARLCLFVVPIDLCAFIHFQFMFCALLVILLLIKNKKINNDR